MNSKVKNFIKLCLNVNPDERPSASELLNNSFFEDMDSEENNYPIKLNTKDFQETIKMRDHNKTNKLMDYSKIGLKSDKFFLKMQNTANNAQLNNQAKSNINIAKEEKRNNDESYFLKDMLHYNSSGNLLSNLHTDRKAKPLLVKSYINSFNSINTINSNNSINHPTSAAVKGLDAKSPDTNKSRPKLDMNRNNTSNNFGDIREVITMVSILCLSYL